jgi:hypothetical protein
MRPRELIEPREKIHRMLDHIRWYIHELKWRNACLDFEIAARRFHLATKAGYNPSQPRVPTGNPDGGQWTSGAQGGAASIGHNQGPPLEDPPEIPKQEPSSAKERNNFLKAAARWLARAIRMGGPVGAFVAAYEAMSWLDTDRPFIEAYQDPPKTLDELQEAVTSPQRGYNIHHIVEQTPAELDGFPRSMIDAPDNLVRIPALKHWEINRWYETKNENYDQVTPRAYVRDKDWSGRTRVGLDALIESGVLKP